jgi:ornithine cyclodeaminase/alanine dehydrogenase-like protein (mu-crystallin family)
MRRGFIIREACMALLFDEPATRKLIDMKTALERVEAIFRQRAAGATRNLPRRRLQSSSRQLNVMAAWEARSDLLCLRAYAGGTNTISLYHGKSGKLLAILDASYLSSLRTGAASGVAAKYLAPPRARTLGLIGPGWQATFQIEALALARAFERVLIFGRDPAKRKRFIREMKKRVGIELAEASSVEELERESDVLVLATDSTAPIVTRPHRLKEELLLITMGANQPVKHEVSAEVLAAMDLVVTDDLGTAQGDSGDLIEACRSGLLAWDRVVPLERVVAEPPSARPKRIAFQSNGIADEDLAVARCVYERARRKKLRPREVREI